MSKSLWCPNCWRRFPLYFKFCPECDAELTDQRPGPPPTPDMQLVRVFSAPDEELAEVAKSLLEGEAIEYLERGSRLQDLFGCGRLFHSYNYIVGPVEFWVCADEADHARACLEGLRPSGPEDAPLSDDPS